MRQEILDGAFQVLLESTDELDSGQDPFEILYKKSRVTRDVVSKILEELYKQDKIGILRNNGEIAGVFINRGLEEQKRSSPFRANAVVLVDVENIRHARKFPKHVFPGEEINDQLKRTGFIVRDRFAFIPTTGLHTNPPATTASEIISQAEILFQQGFIPVLCPFVDEKRPSPDDDMLTRVAHFCHGHPDIESFVIVSGDRDFSEAYQEAERQGHDCYIMAPSSNMNQSWRERSGAINLDLTGTEMRSYDFISRYLVEITENKKIIKSTNDEDENAAMFLDHVVLAVKKTKRQQRLDFMSFCDAVRKNLPDPLKALYQKDFLGDVIHLLASDTDIISKTPSFMTNGQPGTLFSYNTKSKILWLFTGDAN